LNVERVDTLQSASLEASRPVESRSADLPEAPSRAGPEPAAARASPARAEVSISREARQRSLERERFPEGSAASARAEPADEPRAERSEVAVEPLPALAVRFGPAPIATPRTDAEGVLAAEGLSTRARIRGVGAVLVPPRGLGEPLTQAAEERAAAQRGDARAEAVRDPLTTAPGSEEEAVEAPPLFGEERAAAQASPLPRAQTQQPEATRELRGLERPELEVEREERDLERGVVLLGTATDSPAARVTLRDEAPKLAPAAAPVQQRPGVEPRPDVPAENTEPLGRKLAERAFTRAGIVAAESADELVTRFLENTPAPDPGPEPRVRIERISERG